MAKPNLHARPYLRVTLHFACLKEQRPQLHTHYKCTITTIPTSVSCRVVPVMALLYIYLFKCGYFQGEFTWISAFVCLIKVMRAQFGLGHFTIIRQIIFGWIWAGRLPKVEISHCKTHKDWTWYGWTSFLLEKWENIIKITWPFSYCHFIFMHFWKVLICYDGMPCNEWILNIKRISPNPKLTIFHNI